MRRFPAACCFVFEKYVMPATYVLVVGCGLVTAQRVIVPRLPSLEVMTAASACPQSRLLCHERSALALPPRTPPWAVGAYAAAALCSWLGVLLTDPGTVCARTHARLRGVYARDGVLFRAQPCRTCARRKPARSKHCALCGRCVARFDHHCGWVGTCVGLYNARLFVAFLALHALMAAHGAALCAEVVRARVQQLVRDRFVFARTGRRITAFSVRLALGADTVVSVFFVVLALLFVMIASFLAYHVYLVARNVTTNESWKRAEVRDAIRRFAHSQRISMAEAVQQAREECAFEDGKHGLQYANIDQHGTAVNIYDRGLVRNVWEVLCPHSFVEQRNKQAALSRSHESLKAA